MLWSWLYPRIYTTSFLMQNSNWFLLEVPQYTFFQPNKKYNHKTKCHVLCIRWCSRKLKREDIFFPKVIRILFQITPRIKSPWHAVWSVIKKMLIKFKNFRATVVEGSLSFILQTCNKIFISDCNWLTGEASRNSI